MQCDIMLRWATRQPSFIKVEFGEPCLGLWTEGTAVILELDESHEHLHHDCLIYSAKVYQLYKTESGGKLETT